MGCVEGGALGLRCTPRALEKNFGCNGMELDDSISEGATLLLPFSCSRIMVLDDDVDVVDVVQLKKGVQCHPAVNVRDHLCYVDCHGVITIDGAKLVADQGAGKGEEFRVRRVFKSFAQQLLTESSDGEHDCGEEEEQDEEEHPPRAMRPGAAGPGRSRH